MKVLVKGMAVLIAVSHLLGCVSLHSVSLTSIPSERSKKVEAQADNWVFLAFNFSNDYVQYLPDKLRSQCEGGKVTGILTKHYVVHYVFVHKAVVEASGFCVKGKVV